MQHEFENKLLGATSAERLIINAFGMAASTETLQESRDGENKLGGVNTTIGFWFFFSLQKVSTVAAFSILLDTITNIALESHHGLFC